MTYKYENGKSSPNHSGRRTKKVAFIVIHHWGIDGQEFETPRDYLCRLNGTSSAHYIAEENRVACIVDPDNIAWHAGNWQANTVSIGIECRPEAREGDYETVAELIADLRKVYGDLPLFPHNKFQNTACPGRWDLVKLDRMAREIAEGSKKKTNPTKKKPEVEAGEGAKLPKSVIRNLQGAVRVKMDGIWGPDTNMGLGAVRVAAKLHGEHFPFTVTYAQKRVGSRGDGDWGPRSKLAHDRTVKRIQKALRQAKLYRGAIDGVWGERTESAFLEARQMAKR